MEVVIVVYDGIDWEKKSYCVYDKHEYKERILIYFIVFYAQMWHINCKFEYKFRLNIRLNIKLNITSKFRYLKLT